MMLSTPLEPDIVIQERYRIVMQIGKGGMGTVYQAIDLRLDAVVALKHILANDTHDMAIARREAQMLTKLRHIALPRVMDFFNEGNSIFLVMEFIDGPDLALRLEQASGPLSLDLVLGWADQLLQVLAYLHGHDPAILHLDIKPQNLKVTDDNQLVALDMGVAHEMAGPDSQTITIAGTPQYAPPEQFEGRQLDWRSDLYATAATLYHLLTATPPATAVERLSSQVQGQPDPLPPAHLLNPAIPLSVSNLLLRTMSLDMAERPASAESMRIELQQARANPHVAGPGRVEAQLAWSAFLSYSRANMDYARTLHDRLEAEGLDIRWDQENLPGQDWSEQLVNWLRDMHALILLVSRHSIGSDWVKNEVLTAMDLEKPIYPVWLDRKKVLLEQPKCGLVILLRHLQRLDAWDGRDPVPDLLRVLQQDFWQKNGHASTGKTTASDAPEPDNPPDPPDWPPPAAAQAPPLPSRRRARLTLVRPGRVEDFDQREQEGFLRLVTRVARIARNQLQIVRIQAGSVLITLELPESTARWLQEAHQHNDEVARMLDIQDVRDFQVLGVSEEGADVVEEVEDVVETDTPVETSTTPIVPSPVRIRQPPEPSWWDRLSQALQPPTMRLAGAGVLLAVVLLAVLFIRGMPGAEPANLALCSDLTLTSGRCPSGAQFAFFNDAEVSVTLSGAEESFPRVITPRGSELLTLTPTIRWTAVAETQNYTITLREGVTDLWSTTVAGTTELTYPADAPELERGKVYRFVVRADNGETEEAQGIGFRVLNEEDAAPIEAEAQAVRDQGLDSETTAVLLANLYASNGLFAEALELLEPLAATTTQPAVELLRGNLYVAIDLPDLALDPYEHALALAEQAGNPLAQALAHERLGEVQAILGNFDQARSHYEQAIQLFRQLRNNARASELQERLDVLPE